MKLIPLTQGYFAIIDDEDFDRVNQFKWHACRDHKRIYAKRTIFRKERNPQTLRLHRFITKALTGHQVDHKDGNGLNNQKANLRICTNVQNMRNRDKLITNTSGYKGVYIRKERPFGKKIYRSHIGINGKKIYLGYFYTAKEAASAYDKKAVELFGEFARTNFK